MKRRFREDLVNVNENLVGENEEEGARLFLVVPSDRTGGNGHKLQHMKFHLKHKTLSYCEGSQALEEVT